MSLPASPRPAHRPVPQLRRQPRLGCLLRRLTAGGAGGDFWYFAGDIARRRPDGALEFLGRRDYRVKVNGHTALG